MRNINERKKLMYFALVAIRCKLHWTKEKKSVKSNLKSRIKWNQKKRFSFITLQCNASEQVKIGHCMKWVLVRI